MPAILVQGCVLSTWGLSCTFFCLNLPTCSCKVLAVLVLGFACNEHLTPRFYELWDVKEVDVILLRDPSCFATSGFKSVEVVV